MHTSSGSHSHAGETSFFSVHKTDSDNSGAAMRFCEADLCCSPLRLFSGAGFDATINRMGRRSSGIHHRFPRGIHITHYHSQSIACWPFLSRDSQPHLPNSSFLRLRSGSFAPQLPDDTVPCRSDLEACQHQLVSPSLHCTPYTRMLSVYDVTAKRCTRSGICLCEACSRAV